MTIARLVLIISLAWPTLAQSGQISLWRIQQGASTLYLLGSIHAVKLDLYPLPIEMEQAFESADQLVLEIDLGLTSPAAMATAILARGTYPLTENLSASLSPETQALLTRYMRERRLAHPEERGLTLAGVQRMRPWYLAMLLTVRQLAELGFDPALGIDQHYFQKAQALGKAVHGLETLDMQISLLAAGSALQQDLILRSALESSAQYDQLLSTLMAAWEHGEVDKMYKLAMADNAAYPALEELMLEYLDRRNLQMADQLSAYLSGGKTTLVIVGALHMGGDQGLLALLGKNYPITQLETRSRRGRDNESRDDTSKNTSKNSTPQ